MSESKLNWQQIYLDYSPKLLGICRRYIENIHEAEDVVQESFITAIQKNNQLKDKQALLGWLKKIVVNNALQFIRNTNKINFISTENTEVIDTSTETNPYFMDENTQILAYDFTHEELLESIDSLSPHHKSVFNLYFIENYSHADIANLLQISVNTSKSHLLRAKKSVQKYLLTHFVTKETPKKKTAQLLILLGLGNLVWAQSLRRKFSDFNIKPSKQLEIPTDIKSNNIIFSNTNLWFKKAIITSTFLIIIITCIFSLNPAKFSFNHFENINNDKSFAKFKAPPIKEFLNSNNQNIFNEEEKIVSSISETETPVEKTKNKITSESQIDTDSAEIAPQKIIIVKKIIQRDTVYIDREN